jgi:hypothetical protein
MSSEREDVDYLRDEFHSPKLRTELGSPSFTLQKYRNIQ